MTKPSKTPRTDIRKFRKGDLYDPSTKAGTLYVSSETEFVEAGFCAAIERELSTARSMLADLERQFGKLLAKLKAAPQVPITEVGAVQDVSTRPQGESAKLPASAAPDSGMPEVPTYEWWHAISDRSGIRVRVVAKSDYNTLRAYALLAHPKAAPQDGELESLRAFKRSVDEALNSGDGTYRP